MIQGYNIRNMSLHVQPFRDLSFETVLASYSSDNVYIEIFVNNRSFIYFFEDAISRRNHLSGIYQFKFLIDDVV